MSSSSALGLLYPLGHQQGVDYHALCWHVFVDSLPDARIPALHGHVPASNIHYRYENANAIMTDRQSVPRRTIGDGKGIGCFIDGSGVCR
jgi:hypothetical protein